MDSKFEKALAAIIREQVIKQKDIEIPGLGIFRLEHQKQHQKQFDNGRVVMVPPKDSLVFVPENDQNL